jgi:hypothetical protein
MKPKKINVLFILLVMCCFSCTTVKEKETTDKMNGKSITIMEFDSCEYVGFFDGSGYHYTHKGNCKYCAKRSLIYVYNFH